MPSYQIPLSNGMIALVDEADAELVAGYPWYAHRDKSGHWYVNANLREAGKWKRTVVLHRLILDAAKGVRVDHIDGNGLNCQRSNLRLCDAAQNGSNRKLNSNNTSGYRGIVQDRQTRRWYARLKHQRKTICLKGSYATAEEAARAYDNAARKYHGEFASLNFPRPGERSVVPVQYPPSLFGTRSDKRWSRMYDSCIECGTARQKHEGHGLCLTCYNRKARGRRSQGEQVLGQSAAM